MLADVSMHPGLDGYEHEFTWVMQAAFEIFTGRHSRDEFFIHI